MPATPQTDQAPRWLTRWLGKKAWLLSASVHDTLDNGPRRVLPDPGRAGVAELLTLAADSRPTMTASAQAPLG